MTMFDAFLDELEKIAASKVRKGKPPIRVENLTKKTTYRGGDGRGIKLAALRDAAKAVGKAVWDRKKELGLVGAGVLGKGAYDDWKLGRRVRKSQR